MIDWTGTEDSLHKQRWAVEPHIERVFNEYWYVDARPKPGPDVPCIMCGRHVPHHALTMCADCYYMHRTQVPGRPLPWSRLHCECDAAGPVRYIGYGRFSLPRGGLEITAYNMCHDCWMQHISDWGIPAAHQSRFLLPVGRQAPHPQPTNTKFLLEYERMITNDNKASIRRH